jgi:hypothetical protein
LSYVWGDDSSNLRNICINGRALKIRENLHSLLLQLREDGHTGPVWADALCINQAHTPEKTLQVQMMKHVYERANLVISWLGAVDEADRDAVPAAFDLLRSIHTSLGKPSVEDLDLSRNRFDKIQDIGLPKTNDPHWKALGAVIERPYWFRVWIVQEILAARRCLVRYCTHTIDCEVILAFAAMLSTFPYLKYMVSATAPLGRGADHANVAASPADMLRELQELHNKRRAEAQASTGDDAQPRGQPSPLPLQGVGILVNLLRKSGNGSAEIIELLLCTRGHLATDPRDRVFALVGLASDVPMEFIDYKKPVAQMQIELAELCMRTRLAWGPLVLLYVEPSSHPANLPCWVPDWMRSGPLKRPLSSFNSSVSTEGRLVNWVVDTSGVSIQCVSSWQK